MRGGPPPGPAFLVLLSVVSFGLLVALTLIWARTYRDTKSKFSLGLLLFALFLALQEGVSVLLFMNRIVDGGRPDLLQRLELLGGVGQVVALGILLYNVAR